MNKKQKDTYLAWMKDAHAMELALVTTLEKQIADAEGKPDMQARLAQHLEETKIHAQKIADCIERNGGDTSTAKDLMGKMGAALSGISMSIMSDLEVKNIHSAYAAEHFEIASYMTIRAAAEACGDAETVETCDEILKDEHDMAEWVAEKLPLVVTQYINGVEE